MVWFILLIILIAAIIAIIATDSDDNFALCRRVYQYCDAYYTRQYIKYKSKKEGVDMVLKDDSEISLANYLVSYLPSRKYTLDEMAEYSRKYNKIRKRLGQEVTCIDNEFNTNSIWKAKYLTSIKNELDYILKYSYVPINVTYVRLYEIMHYVYSNATMCDSYTNLMKELDINIIRQLEGVR